MRTSSVAAVQMCFKLEILTKLVTAALGTGYDRRDSIEQAPSIIHDPMKLRHRLSLKCIFVICIIKKIRERGDTLRSQEWAMHHWSSNYKKRKPVKSKGSKKTNINFHYLKLI